MQGGKRVFEQRRLLSFTISMMFILSPLMVGLSIQIQNASAGSVGHDVGNLDIELLTDYGRILYPIYWYGRQTVMDNSTLAFIGLVIDHDNYDHTPGSEDIADSFNTYPYLNMDDFTVVKPLKMVIDDGTLQKSVAEFENTGVGTGYPNDILINQTCWTVKNKDWAILQWTLSNIKSPSTTLTNVRIGLEVPISKEGGRYGLGGNLVDSGDDVDGYDATNDIYWARDLGDDTTIGFASAIVTDPITHYYAEDYHAEYENPSDPSDPDPKYYKNFFGNDSWLYERISAPSATATNGVTPGNITTTVGWDGFDILAGESRTVTLVIAINSSFSSMITAIEEARYYYHNLVTGFQITEIRDSGSASARVEVFNNGREPLVNPGSLLSLTSSTSGPLTGTWSNDPIPTYGYSYLDISGGTIDAEVDTITLEENSVPIDQVSFGQDGVAPDPLAGESTGRRFNTSTGSYTDEWLRDPTPTWGSENDVGIIITSPMIVINRVLFNPFPGDPEEMYVELMYRGFAPGGINIANYRIVCDDVYLVPSVTLTPTDRFYVFRYSDMPAFFTDPNGITPSGDNVYLYNVNDDLLDMVGWSSPHSQGRFMSRMPDGNGTYQGYDDATSQAAGWVFDQMPKLIITEFYADSSSAQIEVYNPRGGDKVLPPRWTLEVMGGMLTGNWNNPTITWNGYEWFTMAGGGIPGDEGDTISLFYEGSYLRDEVSYGTSGLAPDPLNGETTARYWDSSIAGYNDDWTREDAPTFGAQNDVPPINKTSFVILNEVMFNPILIPDGEYVVLINRNQNFGVNISNYYLVCDDAYQLPLFNLTPGGFDGLLNPLEKIIIKYGDDPPVSDNFFHGIDSSGDNVYLYDTNGRLLDMVGWNNPFTTGMSVRRVPDGNGTYRGYNDFTSIAAGWVFNSPLQVLVTEISDDDSTPIEIEVYNPWYPTIDFSDPVYIFESNSGQIIGHWIISTAGGGQYALFQVTGGTLASEGDVLSFKQNSILVDNVPYGQYGVVPDPLSAESVERYWDGISYTNVWERNWFSGSNFGFQNDVPPANFSSAVLLNEILFYPNVIADGFIELYLLYGSLDISNYKIVGNTEFNIPFGTVLDTNNPFFCFTLPMDPAFFANLNPSGDNIYLYDDNGSLLDMAGWSSLHNQGKSMRRIPDGNGTRDGYNDTSSIAAGWVFDCIPTPAPTPPPPPAPPTGLHVKLVASAKDVMLSWNASADDGKGENDVVGYSVYKSSTGVNGSYVFEEWIQANGSLSYNWTDINAGDGDWNDYFYIVRANDTLDNEEQNENKVGKFVNYLVVDWNLFSVPLIQINTSMEYVLQTIKGNYITLQGYHAGKSRPWLHWHKPKPHYFNDIIEINHKNGYYINMLNPDYLIVAGKVPTNTQIPLKTGWNLIGYPCLINKTVNDALSSIAGKYNIVEYYDTVKDREVRLEPDDYMKPGLGYWIHAIEDCVIIM